MQLSRAWLSFRQTLRLALQAQAAVAPSLRRSTQAAAPSGRCWGRGAAAAGAGALASEVAPPDERQERRQRRCALLAAAGSDDDGSEEAGRGLLG